MNATPNDIEADRLTSVSPRRTIEQWRHVAQAAERHRQYVVDHEHAA